MRLLLCCAVVALWAVGAAAQTGTPVVSDSRIKTFVYNENDVYSLLTHYGYQSNVEFAKDERVKTVSVGDRVGWQIIPAGRRLFIKAMEENAHTNMTVVTNERAYQFDLKSSGRQPLQPDEELVYVVRFFYPEAEDTQPMPPVYSDQSAMGGMMQQPSQPMQQAPMQQQMMMEPAMQQPMMPQQAPMMEQGLGPEGTGLKQPMPSAPVMPVVSESQAAMGTPQAVNYLYTFEGHDALAPVKIYDNGRDTTLEFAQPVSGVSALYLTPANEWQPVAVQQTDAMAVQVPVVAPQIIFDAPPHRITVFNEAMAQGAQ